LYNFKSYLFLDKYNSDGLFVTLRLQGGPKMAPFLYVL